MIFKGNLSKNIDYGNINLRCPSCKYLASFVPFVAGMDLIIVPTGLNRPGTEKVFMQRQCPSCSAHVFAVVMRVDGTVVVSYPPERLKFDPVDIPTNITASLEESITCHANNCYVASAIMVRKTLELLCHDKQATGSNLKARIQSLRSKVTLPTELFDGLDDLRLLGNDAAHIESQEFENVSKDELDTAIEFATEVLKAVYQYKSLLNKFKALKKTP